MVDFALGVESPLHRVIDYGVVLNGGIELELEDGQRQVVNEGDIGINRTCSHKWRNITSNGTLPGRMLYILLDCNGDCQRTEPGRIPRPTRERLHWSLIGGGGEEEFLLT